MNFTRCSIEHARPVKLCKECVNDYVQFFNTYQQLLHTEVNGTTCKSMYLSHDRFEVVLSYYNSIDAIWDKGNCNGSLFFLKYTAVRLLTTNLRACLEKLGFSGKKLKKRQSNFSIEIN